MLSLGIQGKPVYQKAPAYFGILSNLPFTHSYNRLRNMNLNDSEGDNDNDDAGFAIIRSRKQELDFYW